MTTENQFPAEGSAINPSFSPPPGMVFPDTEPPVEPAPIMPLVEPPTRMISFGAQGVLEDSAPQPAVPEPQPQFQSTPVPTPSPQESAPEASAASYATEQVEEPVGVERDLGTLDPETPDFELSDGRTVEIKPLRTRELLKLLRIVTRGGAGLLGQIDLQSGEDASEFAGRLLAIVMFAIPEADEESVDFLRAMVQPKGLIDRARTKEQKEYNAALEQDLADFLDNPEISDTIGIISKVVVREAPNIQALGKQFQVLLPLALRS